jgi:hypothetical protein
VNKRKGKHLVYVCGGYRWDALCKGVVQFEEQRQDSMDKACADMRSDFRMYKAKNVVFE